MTALSSADKLKLRVSAKRVEAWNRYKLTPAKVVKRCTLTIFSPGQDKGEESIGRDLLDDVYRQADGYAMRSADDKISNQFKRQGDSFYDYGHDLLKAAPIGASEKAVKNGSAYVYKAAGNNPPVRVRNKPSPFKRNAMASVKVERI